MARLKLWWSADNLRCSKKKQSECHYFGWWMDVVLKELEKLIYIPVSQYKGDVSGNNNMKEPSLQLQFPMKPTMQSSQNCQNLNLTQFQMTYRSQILHRNMVVSVGPMSLFHTSHYFRLLFIRFFHYWDLWHLISSFMLNTTIDFYYNAENVSSGLHVRSVGCFTYLALKMWLNSWCAFNLSFSSCLVYYTFQ